MGSSKTQLPIWYKSLVIAGITVGALTGLEKAAQAAVEGDTRTVEQFLGTRTEAEPGSRVEYVGGRAIVKNTNRTINQYQTREETYQQTGSHVATRSVQVPVTETEVTYVTSTTQSYVPYPDPDNYPGVPKVGSTQVTNDYTAASSWVRRGRGRSRVTTYTSTFISGNKKWEITKRPSGARWQTTTSYYLYY